MTSEATMVKCRFCHRSDGVLLPGEPRRVGIQRGSTRYRVVTPYHHESCLQREREFNDASRERSMAEGLEGIRQAMRDQGWSEDRIAAALAATGWSEERIAAALAGKRA